MQFLKQFSVVVVALVGMTIAMPTAEYDLAKRYTCTSYSDMTYQDWYCPGNSPEDCGSYPGECA